MPKKIQTFILDCIRNDSPEAISSGVRDFFSSASSTDITELMQANVKILAPLGSWLKDADTECVPEELRRISGLNCLGVLRNNLKTRELMAKIASAFAQQNTDVVFLKGTGLLATIYREDPALRPMADIDILIKPEDLKQAQHILQTLGAVEDYERFSLLLNRSVTKDYYSKKSFHYIYFLEQAVVELHWDIGYRSSPQLLKELFADREHCPVNNALITVFNAEGSLLLTILNFTKDFAANYPHDWYRSEPMKQRVFYDLAFLMYEMKRIIRYYKTTIRWDRFLDLARLTGRAVEILILLNMADRMVGADIPVPVLRRTHKSIRIKTYDLFCRHFRPYDYVRHLLLKDLCAGTERDFGRPKNRLWPAKVVVIGLLKFIALLSLSGKDE